MSCDSRGTANEKIAKIAEIAKNELKSCCAGSLGEQINLALLAKKPEYWGRPPVTGGLFLQELFLARHG
jgi:hypothetical protein